MLLNGVEKGMKKGGHHPKPLELIPVWGLRCMNFCTPPHPMFPRGLEALPAQMRVDTTTSAAWSGLGLRTLPPFNSHNSSPT